MWFACVWVWVWVHSYALTIYDRSPALMCLPVHCHWALGTSISISPMPHTTCHIHNALCCALSTFMKVDADQVRVQFELLIRASLPRSRNCCLRHYILHMIHHGICIKCIVGIWIPFQNSNWFISCVFELHMLRYVSLYLSELWSLLSDCCETWKTVSWACLIYEFIIWSLYFYQTLKYSEFIIRNICI